MALAGHKNVLLLSLLRWTEEVKSHRNMWFLSDHRGWHIEWLNSVQFRKEDSQTRLIKMPTICTRLIYIYLYPHIDIHISFGLGPHWSMSGFTLGPVLKDHSWKAWRTIKGFRNETQVGWVPGKCFACYAVSLALHIMERGPGHYIWEEVGGRHYGRGFWTL